MAAGHGADRGTAPLAGENRPIRGCRIDLKARRHHVPGARCIRQLT